MNEQATIDMTAVVDGQPWTVWVAAPDFAQSAIRACPGSVRVEVGAVDVSPQYRQITSLAHAAGCSWGENLSPVCTCAPAVTDPAPLYAAAVELLDRHRELVAGRESADARRVAEREEATTAWMREPGRIVVGGSDAGWRLWERRGTLRGSGWRNTGEVVAPPGPITDHDPHLVDVWDDVIGLYSIRDPR